VKTAKRRSEHITNKTTIYRILAVQQCCEQNAVTNLYKSVQGTFKNKLRNMLRLKKKQCTISNCVITLVKNTCSNWLLTYCINFIISVFIT